ncbi:hypothetical protein BC830DRAFT_1126616, partial [Chytriomyces sp. MP71]
MEGVDEVQVMPGVYLTTFSGAASRPNPETAQKEVSSDLGGEARTTVSGIPVDGDIFESENAEVLQEEIARLRLSVQKLLESNALLKEFMQDDADPEYALAIQENVAVIDRRLRMIKVLMQKLAAVSGAHMGAMRAMAGKGPCHAEFVGMDPSQAPSSLGQASANGTPNVRAASAEVEQSVEEEGVYL